MDKLQVPWTETPYDELIAPNQRNRDEFIRHLLSYIGELTERVNLLTEMYGDTPVPADVAEEVPKQTTPKKAAAGGGKGGGGKK